MTTSDLTVKLGALVYHLHVNKMLALNSLYGCQIALTMCLK